MSAKITDAVPGRSGVLPRSARPQVRSTPELMLPAPSRKGLVTLEEALSRRRSLREFTEGTLTKAQMGQLLWAAQGITGSQGLRTTPSAGGLYALELYVAIATGLYRYVPESHHLERKSDRDLRPELNRASGQEAVLRGAAVFVIAAVYSRLAGRYGKERSIRYAHLEAGHAAQNLLLQAAALGLVGVPVGAFHDDQVHRALSLPGGQAPLYLIPVGVGAPART